MKTSADCNSVTPDASSIPKATVRIAICGGFQRGKSLLVNCLLQRRVARVGQGNRTTSLPVAYEWGANERVEVLNEEGKPVSFDKGGSAILSLEEFLDGFEALNRHAAVELDPRLRPVAVRVLLPDERLRQIILVDTPGLDFDAKDTSLAETASDAADFVLLVTLNMQLSDLELKFLLGLTHKGKPCGVLFNCWGPDPDKWSPDAWLNREHAEDWAASLNGILHYRVNGQKAFNFVWWAFAENVAGNGPQEAEAWRRRLHGYFDAFDGLKTPANDELFGRSGGDAICRFIFAKPEESLGWNAPCIGALHREADEWAKQTRKRIQQMRSTINQIK